MAGRPQPPKSLLGRHRLLAPTASVRVSPFSLGGMSFGTNWGAMMGECTKETAFEIMDTFSDLGGNFIDTANAYQGGQSEEWIGEWMAGKAGRRDEMVVATKYSMGSMVSHAVLQSNFGGTGTKSMHVAIEASLKRLQTTYVDLFYVHFWDFATGIPELMQSLNTLVQQSKVLYLGISDAPAWVVVKANAYARQHGLRPFSVYQGRFSAHARDLERDVIPMCRDEGMGLHPWGVMGSGFFRSPSKENEGSRKTSFILNGREEPVSQALDGVAQRLGTSINSVALAYVLHKAPYIFPTIGGRKVEHLKSNVEALSLHLSPEDIDEIENGYDFDLGFPHSFLSKHGKAPLGPEDINVLDNLGYFDYVKKTGAVQAHQGDLGDIWKA